jgi:hypothetical protein
MAMWCGCGPTSMPELELQLSHTHSPRSIHYDGDDDAARLSCESHCVLFLKQFSVVLPPQPILDGFDIRKPAFSFSSSPSHPPAPCPGTKTPRTLLDKNTTASGNLKEKTRSHLSCHGLRCRAKSPRPSLRPRLLHQPLHRLPLPSIITPATLLGSEDTAIAPAPTQKRRHVEVPQHFEDFRFPSRQRSRMGLVLRRDIQRHP